MVGETNESIHKWRLNKLHWRNTKGTEKSVTERKGGGMSKKKNYIKTVCMLSISEFQYAFQAHPALLQLLRKYPQIFPFYMYTVLNKQMFNKWNRSVKKSTKKLWTPWKNNAMRNDILEERSHMWTLKNTDVKRFLSKHSVWHIRIFPFFHLMDSTFVKVNQVLLVRAEKSWR